MHVISTSDLAEPGWTFLRDVCDDPDITWSGHSGRPKSLLERFVRRPHIGRYRSAWQAVREAGSRPDALLVGHLPLMSASTNVVRRRLCSNVPMIGFSFNFTALPTGVRRRYLAHSLKEINEFVVYSRFEQALYPDYFGLDPARFRFLPWAMDPPKPSQHLSENISLPYLCAIGGEGRDYKLLAEVMRALPRLRMVIVARPYSITGVEFPDNVQVFTNMPLADTWAIAANSIGLAIPLISSRTACGHITLVGAQQLGIPLIVTRSEGVNDYITDNETGRLVPAGDAVALRAALIELMDAPETAQTRAIAAQAKARSENDPAAWVEYFSGKKQELFG